MRSMGALIAQKLGFSGSLSALHRLNEGAFMYENEKALNPLEYLDLDSNTYCGDMSDILLGRKLQVENFEKQEEGIYYILNDEMLSIVQLSADGVEYLLNSLSLKA